MTQRRWRSQALPPWAVQAQGERGLAKRLA